MASVKFILLNLDSGFLIAKFSTIKNDTISNLTQASRSNDYLSQTFFFFFDIKENLKGHLAYQIPNFGTLRLGGINKSLTGPKF